MPEVVGGNAFWSRSAVRRARRGPEQLRKNLARYSSWHRQVPDGLIRASVASYARYWREASGCRRLTLRCWPRADEVSIGQVSRGQPRRGPGRDNRLPHSGNWDMSGVWNGVQARHLHHPRGRLKPESLYRRFIAYRESLASRCCPLPAVTARRTKSWQSGSEPTRLLPDGRARTSPARRAGRPSAIPRACLRVRRSCAIDTGAALLPTHSYYLRDRWSPSASAAVHILGDVAAITQKLADHFARNIAAQPRRTGT